MEALRLGIDYKAPEASPANACWPYLSSLSSPGQCGPPSWWLAQVSGDDALVLPFHILTGKCDPFPSPSHTWTSIPTAHIPWCSIYLVLGKLLGTVWWRTFHPADTGWTIGPPWTINAFLKLRNQAGPVVLLGTCLLFVSSKGEVQTSCLSEKEGIQRQGRSSQETIESPGSPSKDAYKSVFELFCWTKAPPNIRC